MEKLIQEKISLESKISELKEKQKLNILDTELQISLIKLENELMTINNRIKRLENQQKSIDFNNIKDALGITFTNYYYGNGGENINNPPNMIYKTVGQLQMEYMNIVHLLDIKLNNGEIDEKRYDVLYTSLSNLFSQYKKETVIKEIQFHHNNDSNIDENVFGDMAEFIDDDLFEDPAFIELFKIHRVSDYSVDDLKNFITNYRKIKCDKDSELVEDIDQVEHKPKIF